LQPKYFSESGEDSTGGVGLYRGYVKTGYKDLEIQVGRDDLLWGPGVNSLLFSGNDRPLDMIKVSSPSPFRLPGFLKNLGNLRTTAFFSLLGNDYTPAHATLSGYRIDYSPMKWWDIGLDHVVFLGGEGLVAPDFTTAIREFTGIVASSRHDQAATNHLAGMDMNFHVPHAMGTELYLKVVIEDINANTGYMLKSDASWLGGVYLPEISGMEKLSIRWECIHTGPYSYRHGQYTDGYALDDKFIGYDAGPDTWSGFMTSRYQFNYDEFFKIDVRYLRRSADHYTVIFNSRGNNIGIVRDLDRPKEGNDIFKLTGQKRLSRLLNLYAEAGYDRKSNADFIGGKAANDFSFRMGITMHQPRPSVR
jgi:hypothetical protein